MSSGLHNFKKRIWMIRIKLLVCPHQGDEVLGIGQVDDVVSPAGNHVNSFDFVAGNLKGYLFIGVDISLLDQRSSADDDEKLPLGIVPMLPLGDAGLGDIDRELTTIDCL